MNFSSESNISCLADAPVFLTGMRASGKSTLGPLIAGALNFAFIDLDIFICEERCCSVGDIVAKGGWPAFRQIEAEALRRVSLPRTVVATGGGTILMKENRDFMRQSGAVIYLEAGAELLWKRLQADPKRQQRPSLNVATPYASKASAVASLDEIKVLLEERKALYQEVAHAVADASRGLNELCPAILGMLNTVTAKHFEMRQV